MFSNLKFGGPARADTPIMEVFPIGGNRSEFPADSRDGPGQRDAPVSILTTIMPDIFQDPAVRAGLAMMILLVVIGIAFWLLARLRDYTTQDHQSTSEGHVNLEEMLRKGDISEAEFRTIKSATRSERVSSPVTTPHSARSSTSKPSSDSSAE